MSRFKYTLLFAHTYLTDMFLLLFIVLIINVHNGKETLIMPFIFIVLAVMTASFLIVRRYRLNRIYYMLPFVIIIALLSGFHWLAALLLAYLPLLRLEYLHDDAETTFSNITLIVTFLLLIGTNILTTEETVAHALHFHMIFLSLVLFFFIGRIFILLVGNAWPMGKNSYIFITLSGLFILLGISLGLVYHYIVFIAKYIVLLLLNGFIFLLRPFFHILENVEFERPVLEEGTIPDSDGEDETRPEFDQDPAVAQLPVDTIMAVLFIIAVITGLYIYYKRRNPPQTDKREIEQTISTSTPTAPQKKRLVRADVPEDRVRKVYFEFEKWLAGKNMGRYQNETIPEWITRLGLTDIIDKQRLTTYIETRYSDTKTADRDYHIYKENIKMMKKEINAHIKEKQKNLRE